MATDVIFDHPSALGVMMAGGVRRLAGGLLLLTGLAATTVAVPATFFVIGLVLGADYGGLRRDELIGVWAVSTAVAIVCIAAGLLAERGRRHVVLFLRRFGDLEATNVMTYAAARAVGGAFRVVTLADSSIRPLGASGGARTTITVAGSLWRGFNRVSAFLVERWVPGALAVALGAGGVAYVATGDVEGMVDVGATLLSGRIPLSSLGTSAMGVFAAAATVAAVSLIALLGVFATMVIRFPLAAVLLMAQSTGLAVEKAETRKLIPVTIEPDIAHAVAEVAGRSRKVIAPRLVVLRVADPVWRETVRRFAEIAEIMLIDVSEPSENLLWEVEHTTARFGARCVFTCHASTVAPLAGSGPADPIVEQLRTMIGRGPILAYTDDHSGMRRFTRALRRRMTAVAR